MQSRTIEIPDIGDFQDVPVIEILVHEGDWVDTDAPLLTLESDKATLDIPAPCGGRVREVLVSSGDRVSRGSPIVILDTVGAPRGDADGLGNLKLSEEVASIAAALDPDAESNTETAPQPGPGRGSAEVSDPPPPSGEADGLRSPTPASNSGHGPARSEITVPDLGGFDEVEIIEIHVQEGDTLGAEDPVVTLESDKASMDVPASLAGRIIEVLVRLGDRVGSGDPLVAIIPAEGGGSAPARAPAQTPGDEPLRHTDTPSAPAGTAPLPVQPKTGVAATREPDRPASLPPLPSEPGARKPHASPAVRLFARQLGVDLRRVTGSAANGRILKEDVQCYVRGRLSQEPRDQAAGPTFGVPPLPAQDFARYGKIERVPRSAARKLSAINIQRAWLNVPQVTHHDEADITELDALRTALRDSAPPREARVTILCFVLRICALVLRDFPTFNSSLESAGEHLILKRYCHIGITVDTPHGQLVPVIRDVDGKGLFDLAAQIEALSSRARDLQLTPEDTCGASFTVASVGAIGGIAFTPLVNAPEVAILGLARAHIRPRYRAGVLVPRLILPLSVSFDHRVIDGAEAARCTRRFTELLADVRQLLL